MLRMKQNREGISIGVLALFTAFGTLLCCALPILLVTLGLGSVVAAITLQLPFLVTLSEHKFIMFTVSAALITVSAWLILNKRQCPTDPQLAQQCEKTKTVSRRVLIIATVLWLTGIFFAYLLLPLREWLNV